MAENLTEFSPEAFDYIIVDEAHHAPAETYNTILRYFHPKFLLGLTATPDPARAATIAELSQLLENR